MNKAAVLLLAFVSLSSKAPSRPLPDVIERVSRSMVQVTVISDEETHLCGGFVVNAAAGYVLTAGHCIGEETDMAVDGQPTTIVKANKQFAILTIPRMSKPPLELRKERPDIGEQTVSMGYPWGVYMAFVRHVAAYDEGDLVLDGPLARGMSGGPTIDADGNVVGINQASNEVVSTVCGVGEIRAFLK